MKYFILLLFLFPLAKTIAQDCTNGFSEYYASIDTTERPVYTKAETMPELLNEEVFNSLFRQVVSAISVECCPMYVWYGFVVEPDKSFSNVFVCSQMEFCKEGVDSEAQKQLFTETLMKEILTWKSKPGVLNGENVAVVKFGRVHFECR